MRVSLLFVVLGLALPAGQARADQVTLERVSSAVSDLHRTAAGVNRILNAASQFERLPQDLADIYEEVHELYIELDRLGIIKGVRDMYRARTSWSMYGAAVAESSLYLGVGVGGQAAWDAPLCRFAGVGADAQLYRDSDDAGLAYAGFMTACIPMVFAALEFTYRPERSVRPRLSARPIFQPMRYSADSFQLRSHNLQYRGDTWEIAFAPMTVDFGWFRQDAAALQDSSFAFQVDADMVRWRRRGKGFLGEDFAVGIISLHVAGRVAEPDGAPDVQSTSYFISPVRIQGKSLWNTGLYLDLEIGWVTGSISEILGPSEARTLRDVTGMGMDIGLRSGTLERRWGLHYGRLVEPTFEQSVLWDKRLSGWFTWAWGKKSTTLEAFAAQTVVHEIDVDRDPSRTGGVTIGQGFVLGERLHLLLRGELARSFFAEDSQDLTPAWTYRAMAVLSSQIGSTR
jgi:hypothetical protein